MTYLKHTCSPDLTASTSDRSIWSPQRHRTHSIHLAPSYPRTSNAQPLPAKYIHRLQTWIYNTTKANASYEGKVLLTFSYVTRSYAKSIHEQDKLQQMVMSLIPTTCFFTAPEYFGLLSMMPMARLDANSESTLATAAVLCVPESCDRCGASLFLYAYTVHSCILLIHHEHQLQRSTYKTNPYHEL